MYIFPPSIPPMSRRAAGQAVICPSEGRSSFFKSSKQSLNYPSDFHLLPDSMSSLLITHHATEISVLSALYLFHSLLPNPDATLRIHHHPHRLRRPL